MDLSPVWLRLLLTTRFAATVLAIVLLVAHDLTTDDPRLIAAVSVYVVGTALVARLWPALVAKPVAWGLDIFVVLALVTASGDWRSPFYPLALTTLAAPAAAMRPHVAAGFGAAFSLTYGVIGHFIGPDPLRLGSQASIETLATHLVLPVFVTFAVSHAAQTMRRLRLEQRRTERMAVEAERRRIAWDLHDSAKQRIHAAHLLVSYISGTADEKIRPIVMQLTHELAAATADMDTSLAELHAPLEGRPLERAIRQRAAEMTIPGGPQIEVVGDTPVLPPMKTAHAYRITAEALTNAVRHADARKVTVTLGGGDGEAVVRVIDDGKGMPAQGRPESTGLRAMRNRARTIGGRLTFGPGQDGRGTQVELRVPLYSEGDKQ